MVAELLRIPAPDELALRLVALGVPHPLVETVVRHSRTLDEPRLNNLLACAEVLDGLAGGTGGMPDYPEGPAAGLDFVVMFAALLPRLRVLESMRRIDPAVTAATVADIGRQLSVYQQRHDEVSFDEQQWAGLHLSGQIHQLGRLQFQRMTACTATAKIRDAGGDAREDDVLLSVHIPRFLGPMSPQACDASIEQARAFHAQHFPDEHIAAAVCWSWLLDPQLLVSLPASNITAFQRRFTPMGRPEVDDSAPLQFGFARPSLPLVQQPRTTSLQRAVLDVLQGGGHWYIGAGFFHW